MNLAQRLRTAVFDIPALREFRNRFQQNERSLKTLRNQVRKLEAEMGALRWTDRMHELLTFLKPRKVVGVEKIRVGRDGDGGYVMLNDFEHVPLAYSLGIAGEVSWDLDIARRGIAVRQYDYSIEEEPVKNALFTFFPAKVNTLDDLRLGSENKQLLKLDIEGSEWEFFASALSADLGKFHQIVGEFHNMDYFHNSEWWTTARCAFEKLNATHQLIHIHGNNDRFAFWTGKVALPIMLELTYVLRSAYKFEDTTEAFPGPYDSPNYTDREKEHVLDSIVNYR